MFIISGFPLVVFSLGSKENIEEDCLHSLYLSIEGHNNIIRLNASLASFDPCRTVGTSLEEIKEHIISTERSQESLAEMSSKMTALRDKNEAVETELKEMQERYTEISLKFAEVEGERQQLVMTVRTLKNSLKN